MNFDEFYDKILEIDVMDCKDEAKWWRVQVLLKKMSDDGIKLLKLGIKCLTSEEIEGIKNYCSSLMKQKK